MKKRKIKLKIIIIISIILLLFWVVSSGFQNQFFGEDILIFNLNKNQEYNNEESNVNNEFTFDMNLQKEANVNVNLYDTLRGETLVNEKIAPGIEGEFALLVNNKRNSSDIMYQIDFKSENEKPKNLVFYIKGSKRKYYNLEDLGNNLQGIVNQHSLKKIEIAWSWQYENGNIENMQDTIDGKNINTYNFNIHILGNSI